MHNASGYCLERSRSRRWFSLPNAMGSARQVRVEEEHGGGSLGKRSEQQSWCGCSSVQIYSVASAVFFRRRSTKYYCTYMEKWWVKINWFIMKRTPKWLAASTNAIGRVNGMIIAYYCRYSIWYGRFPWLSFSFVYNPHRRLAPLFPHKEGNARQGATKPARSFDGVTHACGCNRTRARLHRPNMTALVCTEWILLYTCFQCSSYTMQLFCLQNALMSRTSRVVYFILF